MKELSIFIDESGSFGDVRSCENYYIVTFVFHDQSKDIAQNVHVLEQRLVNAGFALDYIHSGPIIRREDIFQNYTLDERRRLIYAIFDFTRSCPIRYSVVVVERKEAKSKIDLSGKVSRQVSQFLNNNRSFLSSYDKIIVYYDNGQHELTVILNAVFSTLFIDVEFRTAKQREYRLLQTADFICTMELLRLKRSNNQLSKSETKFFYKSNELKKTFLKTLDSMILD